MSLFCGDETCNDCEGHQRAADNHASDLDRFAVFDVVDCFVKLLEVEVLLKPVFAADLHNATKGEGACSEQEPETRVGSHTESAHTNERSDKDAEDWCEQESDVHQRNRGGEFAGDEEPVPNGVGNHRCDGDADADRCSAGDSAVEEVGLTGEVFRGERHELAEVGETVDEVDGGVCSLRCAPSRAEEECGCADCDEETGNTVEVLFVLEEVGHCCFEHVDDVERQHDDHKDLSGEKSETCKQNDESTNEQS